MISIYNDCQYYFNKSVADDIGQFLLYDS